MSTLFGSLFQARYRTGSRKHFWIACAATNTKTFERPILRQTPIYLFQVSEGLKWQQLELWYRHTCPSEFSPSGLQNALDQQLTQYRRLYEDDIHSVVDVRSDNLQSLRELGPPDLVNLVKQPTKSSSKQVIRTIPDWKRDVFKGNILQENIG